MRPVPSRRGRRGDEPLAGDTAAIRAGLQGKALNLPNTSGTANVSIRAGVQGKALERTGKGKLLKAAIRAGVQGKADSSSLSGVWSVRLIDRRVEVGSAMCVWTASAGVLQLLDLNVIEPHRRRGHGRRLLEKVAIEAKRRAGAGGGDGGDGGLRRIWCAVGQKTQIRARAFLCGCGFHHVATVQDLLAGEDLLIYIKSYD